MPDDFQEKTEEATPKKIRDARRKGQVAKSQDLNSTIVLLVALGTLYAAANYFFDQITYLTKMTFQNLGAEFGSLETAQQWLREYLFLIAGALGPLFMMIFIAALTVNIYQVGFEISTEPLVPKWTKINIFDPKNYKRFFDIQAVMRLFFGLSKMAAVGLVATFMIFYVLDEAKLLIFGEVTHLFVFISKNSFYIGIVTTLILFFLAIIDMIYQGWKFRKDLKMSKQEIKDERRQVEGDAQTRGRMRQMLQGMLQTSLKDQVPKADVVVANPIHYAVALKYDAEKMAAPVCVGKGMRKMALYIRGLAEEAGVPVVENPPLAQALHKAVEVGRLVPPDFYQSVAEVLAYVYRMNEKMETKS